MDWPSPQDYNEAIQTPAICFADHELKGGHAQVNALGLPSCITGSFASVYKIQGEGEQWAVRCFLSHRGEQKERYQKISEFVLFHELPCTVSFSYIENGIRVRNSWYPILKMDWVNGDTIDVYLSKNFKNSEKMKTLAGQFASLAGEL